MVVGHAIRAMGRIVKGLVSKSSTAIETKTSGEISLKTFHFSRPVDCDFFFHMNNCMYFRHAELARWELLPRTGILQAALKHKWMFLVVVCISIRLILLPFMTHTHTDRAKRQTTYYPFHLSQSSPYVQRQLRMRRTSTCTLNMTSYLKMARHCTARQMWKL